MFPPVDTKDSAAVERFVSDKFQALFPATEPQILGRLFTDVADLFGGRHPDYQAIDIRYHDFEHTLQATTCLALLLHNRQQSDAALAISARQFELAMASVLLHDAGYLKLRSDTKGTGAKFTFCHVLRGCAFASTYLPTLGVNESEVLSVLGAINCTGPTKEISRLHFRDDVERLIGCALATADYLGQMAASDYPDELEILYYEFQESDDYVHVPLPNRAFKSAADLVAKTPAFWTHFVLKKLEHDFQGVYRFLADPYPRGTNAYLEAVERNLAIIRTRSGLGVLKVS